MKAKKVIYSLLVVGMLAGFAVGGNGNLYAQNQTEQQTLKQLDTLVADLSLSEAQQEKYVQFKSSLEAKSAGEKSMEFVNKLTNVMSF
jgi:hypothetical protein